MSEIGAYDLAVGVPTGWEGRIFRRPEAGDAVSAAVSGPPAPMGERSFPVMQVATVPLPIDVADYGSDVVADLGPTDALIVLKEFDPAEASQPLFARLGMPRALSADDFSPSMLQRQLDGQAGLQVFFNESARAFCLYVVLGNFSRRLAVVPLINDVLGSISISPLPAP